MIKNKKMIVPFAFITLILYIVFNRVSFLFRTNESDNPFLRIVETMSEIRLWFGFPSFNGIDILVAITGLIIIYTVIFSKKGKKNFRKGEEYGSARWGKKADIKPFLAKKEENKVLMSETESLMINEKPKDLKNQRNLNVLVIGGSGSGKTRYVVKPNLMQLNSSYVITDTKGDLIRDTGDMFEKAGYTIKTLNLIDLKKSMHYNPFSYIYSEADILKFVDYLIANTSAPDAKNDFWVSAEKLLYMALIGYMRETCNAEEFNFQSLLLLLNNSSVSDDEDSLVDGLFQDHERDFPDSFAVAQYKKFKQAAGDSARSILISCGTRLAPFEIQDVKELTSYDEMNLETLGDEKTVFYMIISDSSPTFNFLAGILYSQMFNVLIEHADSQPNSKLKVPIQFYLDEFANIGKIPNFERLIATIRSRGMGVVVILQSLAQLKASYKEATDTIVGNCDTQIFLGGKEQETLKSISEMLGKETIDLLNRNQSYGQTKSWSDNNSLTGRSLLATDEIAKMDNSKCIVQIRGLPPFLSNKITLEKRPNYSMLSEADGEIFNVIEYFENHKPKKQEKVFTLTDINTEGEFEDYDIYQIL